MPNTYKLTPVPAGPVKDLNARRVCTLAGITAAEKKLATWRELKSGLDISLNELDAQRKKEQIIGKALLVAKFTKATCDAFIGMATEMTKLVMPETVSKKYEAFSAGYGVLTSLGEAAGTKAAGGKVDIAKTTAGVAKSAASLVTNDGAQLVIKSSAVKVEIIDNAMKKDTKGLIKSSVDYVYDLNTSAAGLAGYKRTAAVANIAKQAFDYNQALGEAFDELIDGDLESIDRYTNLKIQIIRQGRQISKKIGEVEDYIRSCEDEMNQQSGELSQAVTVNPPR